MIGKKFCKSCQRFKHLEGGKYVIGGSKQVYFKCVECMAKAKSAKGKG